MVDKDENVKKMADLLRGGSTMLSHSCPDCKIPLFKLTDGDIICPGCGRKVVFAKPHEVEAVKAQEEESSEIEAIVVQKISRIKLKIAESDDPSELANLSKTMTSLYDLLNRVRREKK